MAIITKQVASSNLDTLEYNDEEKTMTVTFISGGVYIYYNIPKDVFQAIIDAKFTNRQGVASSGATFIKLVKNNPAYTFKKLN